MVPWTQLREPPLWGKCLTDLTSEFTHFNLVIRLSKVQQMAFPFCTAFWVSRWSCGPLWNLVEYTSVTVKPCWTFRNHLFLQQCHSDTASCHDIWTRQVHAFQVWSFSFWWLSGEVKHVVHLIRWNLEAVICRLGQELTTGLEWHNARLLGLGTESCCLTNCFGFLFCHQLVPHSVPNFPRVPLRNVSWGLGVCAVLGQVRFSV